MKKEDQDWVEKLRVSLTATDQEIQQRLRELYSKQEEKTKQNEAMQFLTPGQSTEQCTLRAISESAIVIDRGLRQQMMEVLRNEEQDSVIITKLEDPNEMNEVQVNDKTYRIKQGMLKIHVAQQAEQFSY